MLSGGAQLVRKPILQYKKRLNIMFLYHGFEAFTVLVLCLGTLTTGMLQGHPLWGEGNTTGDLRQEVVKCRMGWEEEYKQRLEMGEKIKDLMGELEVLKSRFESDTLREKMWRFLGYDIKHTERGCRTTECCIDLVGDLASSLVRNMIQTVGGVIADPLQPVRKFYAMESDGWLKISQFIGYVVGFFMINLFAFCIIETNRVYKGVHEAFGVMCRLPLIVCGKNIVWGLWKVLLRTAEEDKKEQKKEGVAEEVADVTALQNKVAELIIRLEKQEAEAKNRDSSRVASPIPSMPPPPLSVSAPPSYQGRSPTSPRSGRGQPSSGRFNANSRVWRPPVCFACNEVGHIREYCPHLRGNIKSGGGGVSEFSFKPTANPSRVTAVESAATERGVRLQTPIMLNEIKVNKVLLDTGAEVNVLPTAFCTKHAVVYQGLKEEEKLGLRGFTEAVVATPVGKVTFVTRIGPSEEAEIDFLIVDGATDVIVGMKTLSKLELSVDCATGDVTHAKSGRTVRCSIVTVQKN